MRASLARILLSSACLASIGIARTALAAVDPGAQLLGQMFVNDAYRYSGDTVLPARLSAREAQILLQFGHDADPENLHTLKLLVEAAGVNGDVDVQRDALRSLIKLDPGDFVAQVQYIDFLASASQALDVRAKIYQAALGQTSLDPQIRSEVAVRLARITRERGDVDGAKDLLKQALQLNNVNVGALRESVQLADQPDERLQALVALLSVNPLDPPAWIQSAQILEGANIHSPAADYLNTALEQIQLSGERAPAEVYLALGIDLGIAGRFAEAYPMLSAMSRFPDAPLHALVAMRLLNEEYTAPASMPGAASQPSADELDTRIHKLVADHVSADPKSVAVLADALWTELSLFPKPVPEVADWMKRYQELVPADDATVARFRGWQLLRDGKLDDARAALEKVAATDPYARLGLARILLAQNKMNDAAQTLQDLWWTRPTGIFAYQVAVTAYKAGGQGIRLAPAATGQPLLEILKQLPPSSMTAHLQSRDYQLITTELNKREYEYGEPILLTIRISNAAPGPAPVGPDGLIKTTFGVLANLRSTERLNLGLVGTEELRRVFRVERRANIEATIRLDQGKLHTVLQDRPIQSVLMNVALVTAPIGTTAEPAPGLGGQLISVGDVQRNPFPMHLPDDVDKLIQGTVVATGDQQMIRAQILGVAAAILSQRAAPTAQPAVEEDPAGKARDKIDDAVGSLLATGSPAMRAYLLLTLPQEGLHDAMTRLEGLYADPDRLVRAAWASRTGVFATRQGDPQALAALQKQAEAEKDPLVRTWINALIDEAKERAAHPATQPATNP